MLLCFSQKAKECLQKDHFYGVFLPFWILTAHVPLYFVSWVKESWIRIWNNMMNSQIWIILKPSTKGGRPLDCEREMNKEGWPSFSSPEQSRLPTSSSRPLLADARDWHGGWKGWWRAGRCSLYCRTGSPDTAAGGSSHSSRVRWSPGAHACIASMARLDDPLVEDWGHTYKSSVL